MTDQTVGTWLLLIYQLPPKPPYLRVKVWRRLQTLGGGQPAGASGRDQLR